MSNEQHRLANFITHGGRMNLHAIVFCFSSNTGMILITLIGLRAFLKHTYVHSIYNCIYILIHFFPYIFRLSFGNTVSPENLFAKQNNQSPVHIQYGNVNMFIQLWMAILSQFVSCSGVLWTDIAIKWNSIGGDDIPLSHDLFAGWLLYNSNWNIWHHVDDAPLRVDIKTDWACI